MKNWKDKVLGIFAGIGIMSLLMATNSQQPNLNYGTPKSHVWGMHSINMPGTAAAPPRMMVYSYNKETGEVRKHETQFNRVGGKGNSIFGAYRVTTPYPISD